MLRLTGYLWLLCLSLWLVPGQGCRAADAPLALFLQESVALDGTVSPVVRLGPVVGLAGGSGVLGGQAPAADAITRAPAFTSATSYASTQAAADAVQAVVAPGLPAVAQSLLAQMRALGLQVGYYEYRAAVRVAVGTTGTTEDRTVVGRMVVRPDASVLVLGFKTTRVALSRTLMVRYEQHHVGPTLPASLARSPAGGIVWQVYGYDGSAVTPIGSPSTEPAGGAYDEPDDPGFTDADLDMDTGLHQLVQWVQTKMGTVGAESAVIDYGRTVEPVYDPQPDDSMLARVTVSLPSRVFVVPPAMPACPPPLLSPPPPGPPTFSQSGQVDYVLQLSTDRYFYVDGVLTPAGTASSQQQATVSTSRSMVLPEGTSPAGFATAVINPVDNPPGQEMALYDANSDPVHQLPASRYLLGALQVIYLSPLSCIDPPPPPTPQGVSP